MATHIYGACGVEGCTDCEPSFNDDNQPVWRDHANGVREVFDTKAYRQLHRYGDVATCGTCGRSWVDNLTSGLTPTPAGRCPFEYEHPEPVVPYERGHRVFWMRNDFGEPKPVTVVADNGGDAVDVIVGHHSIITTLRGNLVVK